MERCANGKIGGGERVLLMSGSHGQLYLSEPFPSPNQVSKGKTNCCEGKERWKSARPAHNKENAQKGFWGKDLFLGIWTVSFQAINKGTL